MGGAGSVLGVCVRACMCVLFLFLFFSSPSAWTGSGVVQWRAGVLAVFVVVIGVCV